MWSLCIVSLLIIISITHWLHRFINPRCKGMLPPGSMGWPLIGETFHFFKPCSSLDISPYIKDRIQKYGPVFRTSLVGKSFIVSTDSDFNHYIFQQEGESFRSWFPPTFKQVMGNQNLGLLHGAMFKFIANMVVSFFGHQGQKKMLSEVEQDIEKTLESWSTKDSVEVKEAAANMVFDTTAKKLMSHDPRKRSDNLRNNFIAFGEGLISFPINIPGTAYHECLQGRKRIMNILKNILEERQRKPCLEKNDFYDYIVEELQNEGTILTVEVALDLMFSLLFASFETTTLAITLAVKLLDEHPLVLKCLTEEHEEILRNRKDSDSRLTWDEYKSMTFTFQLIKETLRLANVAPLVFREALKDIKYKGYTIPAGWPIMLYVSAAHLNPEKYEDPLSFNPRRWGREDKNIKNFMPFGGGMRLCIGKDFSKMQMAVFLHYFVTQYGFKVLKGGETVRAPGLQFPDGLHIKLLNKN